MSKELVKFTVRLPKHTKEKLESQATKAGVSQSVFLCKLLDGKALAAEPPKELWALLEQLYSLHDMLLRAGKIDESFPVAARRLEKLVLALQETFTAPREAA